MINLDNMIDEVRNYLDENEWKYEYDDERKLIATGIGLKCKLRSLRIYISFSENGYSVITNSQMNASEECRAAVAEYITRVNYSAKQGNFEMDYNDGEVRYKTYTHCEGLENLSRQVVENSIVIPVIMYERYGDGLAALLFGFSTPLDEYNKATGK